MALQESYYLSTNTWRTTTVKLNANRHVVGVLRGFDQFLNIVLDSATDEKTKQELGMVVRVTHPPLHKHQHTAT